MSGGRLAVGEEARRLDDDLDLSVAPWDLGRVALGEYLDHLAVDDEAAVGCLHGAVETPVVAVVLQEVGVGHGVDEVVDSDDLEVVSVTLADGTKHLPSNASETINAYSRCHAWLLSGLRAIVEALGNHSRNQNASGP